MSFFFAKRKTLVQTNKNLLSQKILHSILILFVIALHAIFRLSEIPYSRMEMGEYFWVPSINLAAGKGFTNDATFLTESPELANFCKLIPGGYKASQLSPFNSFYNFKDYQVKTNAVNFPDSLGYRILLGYVWKFFGFNWYFAGLLNYIFSLTALLALLFCSYRALGITYSVMIGLVFSMDISEINFLATFGRDAFPLWFASYLICALIMFVNKPLTLKRIASYAVLIGVIIFASIQGRSNCIYFFPLVVSIYFILFFFFQREKIQFKYSHLFKGLFSQKIFLFCFATLLTFSSILTAQKLFDYFFPVNMLKGHQGWMEHVILLGLGIWPNSSQVRYMDGIVNYLAQDYGQRVLEYPLVSYLGENYSDSIRKLYISIITTYPYFFLRTIVFQSFYNTLVHLGHPGVYPDGYSQFLYAYIVAIISKFCLFIFSLIGSFLLYFRMNLKKISVILISFVLLNAAIAFLQYHYRHSLMGHPAYYFLSGVTLGFIFDNYIIQFFYFCVRVLGLSEKAIEPVSAREIPQKISFLQKARSINIKKNLILQLKDNPKKFIRSTMVIVSVFLVIEIFNSILDRLNAIEKSNIQVIQVFLESLTKNPLEFDLNKNEVQLPRSLIGKTIGIYCEVGHVTSPKEININFFGGEIMYNATYHATLVPVVGENVMVFFPISFRDNSMSIQFLDNNQCKAYYWSDLKDWKGPLWEGSYDSNKLNSLPH